MTRYEVLKIVSVTPSSSVAKAHRVLGDGSKEKVALKRIALVLECLEETDILGRLDHPNVVRYYEQFKDKHYVTLVLEWMKHDLSRFLHYAFDRKGNPLAGPQAHLETVKRLLYQLLDGLAYIHAQNVLHLDLKPANLLLSADRQILKIIDFGLSEEFGRQNDSKDLLSTEVVTLYYRAPELFCGSHAKDPAIDIWSVGCIFGEMLSGRPLFYGPFSCESQIREISTYLLCTCMFFTNVHIVFWALYKKRIVITFPLHSTATNMPIDGFRETRITESPSTNDFRSCHLRVMIS